MGWKAVARNIRVFILGSRRVVSGSWPLYRICALMLTISGVIQLVTGKLPGSVTGTSSPEWTDVTYVWMQMLGGALVLWSLMVGMKDLEKSLNLERIGAILIFCSSLTYVVSVVDYNSGVPTSSGVWLVVGVGLYTGFRVWEISRVIRATRHEQEGRP